MLLTTNLGELLLVTAGIDTEPASGRNIPMGRLSDYFNYHLRTDGYKLLACKILTGEVTPQREKGKNQSEFNS